MLPKSNFQNKCLDVLTSKDAHFREIKKVHFFGKAAWQHSVKINPYFAVY